MSREEQNKRYTRLNGDPIHMQFNQAVKNRMLTHAVGLSAIFNLGTLTQADPSSIIACAGGTALAFGLATGIKAISDWSDTCLFGQDHKDLCIDQNPESKTRPTSSENLQRAKTLRFKHLLASAMGTFATGDAIFAGIFISYTIREPLPFNAVALLSTASVLAAAITGDMVDKFNRFNKVSKGDWIITNTPKLD